MKIGDNLTLWRRWYKEGCVAIGFSPPPYDGYKLNGWAFAKARLEEMQIGDKLIPFPKKWRIGPVGRVKMKRISDKEFNPTIQAVESKSGRPAFGRRIEVEWETSGMPPDGKLATVPEAERGPSPYSRLALRTITELTPKRFQELCAILANPSNRRGE
jgi:hypothetical protein